MSRKKWGRSQGWKKMVSGVMSVSLCLSVFPMPSVQAYDVRTSRSLSAMKEWVEKYQEELDSLDVGVSPIKEGVDVTTEEYESLIIEFKSLPKITAKVLDNGTATYSIKDDVDNDHNEFSKFLLSKGKEKNAQVYTIEHSYYDTFNGVAMKVKGTDIPSLLESGVVKAIWKDEAVRVDPEVQNTKTLSDVSSRMVTSTPLIGVDQLRKEGITGKGVKVGVLDTGIDYNHPDLKENYREGGYDFVDNDEDPMETTYQDWIGSKEPEKDDYGNSYYTYHGTHVSGTIGANGKNSESEFAVTGIAPEAEIYGYRVLGPYGVGASSDIIAAIEKSVKDGMDVINLSLGITTASPLYPSSIACNNAAIAGVVPVVANGNAGPEPTTLGSPGTSALAISVGASTTNISIDKFLIETSNGLTMDGKLLARPFSSINNLVEEEYEIVYGGYGFEDELNEIDAEGKILFLERGYISFQEKFRLAKETKAIALILSNNVPGEMNLYFGESVEMIPGIAISMENGQALKEALQSNALEGKVKDEQGEVEVEVEVEKPKAEVDQEKVEDREEKAEVEKVNLTNTEKVSLEEKDGKSIKVKLDFNGKTTTEADKLADFSSRGPSSDETIKPDITAPGVGIFSTYPEYVNSPEEGIDYSTAYARIDGTSMAAPHIAGVAALMIQNNKDITPEEVKVAMMNTAEELAEDYGVNAIGAGRINAYEAVHAKVAIKVLDKCNTLDEDNKLKVIDYITGSMSFDRISKSDKDSSKELNLQILNSSDEEKRFDVVVEFLGENVGSQDNLKNGVTLDIPKVVTVAGGTSVDLNAVMKVPANAALGRYEGFVIFKNTEDSSEDYRIPFSVKYLTPGIESIKYSRQAISNDLDLMHMLKEQGIAAYVTVSSPIESIEIYVKDYKTKEVIGFVGEEDLSYLAPGYSDRVVILNGRGSYFPMDKKGNIDYVRSSLRDGQYTIELVANDAESNAQYKFSHDILVDNEDVKMEMDLEPGVYEISQDMLTTEEYLGNPYEAYWVKGKVSDNSIPLLKEMGYDVDATSIRISGFVNGMPFLGLQVEKDGSFKTGIEMTDLEMGIFEFSPMATDIATSQNLNMPPRYFFIKKGEPYYGVSLNKKEITEGDNITATLNINNVTGSSFETSIEAFNGFEIMDIKVNEQLQKILDKNQYTAKVSKNLTGIGYMNLGLKLEILDKTGVPVDISGTISLLDIDLKLVSDVDCDFNKEYVKPIGMDVKDKDNNYVDISYNGYYDGVYVKMETSTLKTFQMAEGYNEISSVLLNNRELDEYMWVEDSKGTKYEVYYDKTFREFRAINLPNTTEDLKLISAVPGHFKKTAKFLPSRTIDGQTVGKVYYLMGSEFYRKLSAGDVNGDGVIDIHDALAVEKYYGKKVNYKEAPVDFNFDGIVDAFDMDYIVYNFTDYNEQESNRKKAELTYNGKSLEDILEATGYYEEVRLEGIEIDKTYMDLKVGDTEKIEAIITPENLENISLMWSSENEKVATVDSDGNVTAVGPGYTNIKVRTSDGRLGLSCFVNVTLDGESLTITEVNIDEPIREVYVGDEFELNFQVKPYESLVNSVDYISSANSIVSVKDGKAIANSPGKAFVTLSINGGEFISVWEIQVKPISLKSIDLNKDTLKLEKGGEEQLQVTFNPENATNKNVTWTSSDEKVATVVDGKVVAIGKGKAIITVTSEDGGFADTCKVTVTEKDTNKPETPNKPEKPNKPNKPNLPQTGAVAGATMAMAIGVIAVGAGLFLKKKKN